jgi:hypothetical protein
MAHALHDRRYTKILVINPNSSKAMTEGMEGATLDGVGKYPYFSDVCPSKSWLEAKDC